MSDKRYASFKVIIEQEYIVPLDDGPTTFDLGLETRTELDGRTIQECIDEWFGGRFPLDSHHATRDSCRLGGSSRFLGARLVPSGEETRRLSEGEPEPSRAALEVQARAQYDLETDNDPTIHSNRFPTWEELPPEERWRRIDAARERPR